MVEYCAVVKITKEKNDCASGKIVTFGSRNGIRVCASDRKGNQCRVTRKLKHVDNIVAEHFEFSNPFHDIVHPVWNSFKMVVFVGRAQARKTQISERSARHKTQFIFNCPLVLYAIHNMAMITSVSQTTEIAFDRK